MLVTCNQLDSCLVTHQWLAGLLTVHYHMTWVATAGLVAVVGQRGLSHSLLVPPSCRLQQLESLEDTYTEL